jgi:hypothetical protein
MSFDFYRADNLEKPTLDDDERYFRATSYAYPLIYLTLVGTGVLDRNTLFEEVDAASRAERSPVPGTVPAFKLSLNSRFLVVPEECEIIGRALMQVVCDTREQLQLSEMEANGLAFIESFARFNLGAVAHGGYEVH